MEARTRPAAAPSSGGWRAELATLAFFLAAAVALTWPLALTLSKASGLRGDYFLNLWNVWWMRHSLGAGHAPWSTDYLFYPDGLSLQRHILTPVNALAGVALRSVLGVHATFNVLVILTLAVSGWTFALFARHLTGERLGAVLGGLLYTFNPFHFYYLCQTNIFTFEFVPLALLYFVKARREGGARNHALVVLWCVVLASSTLHFVVYTFVVVGLLLVAGKWLDPALSWREGARRTLIAGTLGALAVLLLELPFLLAEASPDELAETVRANDLLGFNWVGGPEQLVVSWPSMLGYSTLLFLLFTARAWWRERFWVLVTAFFLLLSLGEALRCGGSDTGIPLPFGWLGRLPGMHMLRSPDRCFMVVQLGVALLTAFGWRALAERRILARPAAAWSAYGLCVLVPMLELTSVPLARFEYESPAYYGELARDDSVASILELPPRADTTGGTVNFHQITHGKKEVLGLVTSYAIRARDLEHMTLINRAYRALLEGNSHELVDWVRAHGVDLVVQHTQMPDLRPADARIDGKVLWAPFVLAGSALTRIRQIGPCLDRPIKPASLRAATVALQSAFGAPIHQDEELIVFRVRR